MSELMGNDGSTSGRPEGAKLLLRAEEAAAFLGVSRSEFYRWDLAGLCPRAIQLRKIKRWSRAELQRWVEAGCPTRAKWEAAR